MVIKYNVSYIDLKKLSVGTPYKMDSKKRKNNLRINYLGVDTKQPLVPSLQKKQRNEKFWYNQNLNMIQID